VRQAGSKQFVSDLLVRIARAIGQLARAGLDALLINGRVRNGGRGAGAPHSWQRLRLRRRAFRGSERPPTEHARSGVWGRRSAVVPAAYIAPLAWPNTRGVAWLPAGGSPEGPVACLPTTR
jgi:hypothetical protein